MLPATVPPARRRPRPIRANAATAISSLTGMDDARRGLQPPVLGLHGGPDTPVDQILQRFAHGGRFVRSHRPNGSEGFGTGPSQRWEVPVTAAGTTGAPVSRARRQIDRNSRSGDTEKGGIETEARPNLRLGLPSERCGMLRP